jgi:iron complex outermembrane receptor protein
MIRRLAVFIVLVALAGGSARLGAQAGTVQGTITDSVGAGVAGATVSIDNTSIKVTSLANGHYTLAGAPAGAQIIRVRMIRYAQAFKKVTVRAGETVQLDFSLSQKVQTLAAVDVVVGSRGQHTAADELAVPVDIYGGTKITEQGSTETGQILAALSPSVGFPHQSVTDANDIVRPFTLRNLSPDQTLVLVNGWRQHGTALVNTFPYGSPAGSSGVDLNAIPSSAIGEIQVLRDGASSQYGSDAIAGVVNIKMKDGAIDPFLNATGGIYQTGNGYPNDGGTVDLNGGVGFATGAGSLGIFAQYTAANPTNRAWADPSLAPIGGQPDSVNPNNGQIVQKRNGISQPNYHWGDGLMENAMVFVNWRLPVGTSGNSEWYAFGGYSHHIGTGNGFYRYPTDGTNWPEIYPNGFLPQFHPIVQDYQLTGGYRTMLSGWTADFGAEYGFNEFRYDLRNTLNPSLGPSLTQATGPTSDGLPNQLSFDAGALRRGIFNTQINLAKPVEWFKEAPSTLALGAVFQYETFQIVEGEEASWINGGHAAQDSATNPGDLSPAGSSVFGGFSPTDASNNHRTNVGVYADLETTWSTEWLTDVALRFENYSDFGSQLTGKVAARYQPQQQLVFRGAVSTGFRAPGLQQNFFSHTTTNFIGGNLVQIGNFPVTNPAAQLFGAEPLKDEQSLNISAGVAYTPVQLFTITGDVFYIKITNRILLGATFDATQDTVVARILTDAGYTNISGVQFFTNGLDTRTEGVDLTGNYTIPAGRGSWNLNLALNYTQNTITHVAPLPAVLQGTATTYTSSIDLVTQLAITKEAPQWRGVLTGTYVNGRFHGLARASYFGAITSAEPSFTDSATYAPRTLIDGEVGYQFSNINLSVGVRNIFNIYPGRMWQSANNNGGVFPWAAASPFGYDGRYIYIRTDLALMR